VNTSSQVSVAEADVTSARAGIAAAKQQFDAARAQRDEAEANNVKAQNDLVRYKQLVDKQEISQQQYDQAEVPPRPAPLRSWLAHAMADAAQSQVTQLREIGAGEANRRYAETAPRQMQVSRAKAASAEAQVLQKKAASSGTT